MLLRLQVLGEGVVNARGAEEFNGQVGRAVTDEYQAWVVVTFPGDDEDGLAFRVYELKRKDDV